MAQTGFTPIQLYYSTTTSAAPLAANLANGELAINITDGKLFYKDNSAAVQVIGWKTVPTSAGGTGLTTYAQGDLLYYNSGTTLTALNKNTTASRYLSNSGTNNNPAWSQIDLTNGVTGTLPTTNGGTGLGSFTANQVFYASSTSAIAQSSNLQFNGSNLGLGAAPSASVDFLISTNITGGTTSGAILANGAIQSDATSAGYYFQSVATTAAASFTLATLNHFLVGSLTIGSGSAVTNQRGFAAGSGMTGATNNYGFLGNLASATGVWNLYMTGTASNYLAGQLSIGSTTLTSGYLFVAPSNSTATYQTQIAGTNTFNSAGNQSNGFGLTSTLTGTASTTSMFGAVSTPTVIPNASATISGATGTLSVPALNSTVTPTNFTGTSSGIQLLASATGGTITNAYTYFAQAPTINASATTGITNYYQYNAQNVVGTAGSAIGTVYGFYANQASSNTGVTTNWNFYANGTANNAFRGNSRFGGLTAPVATVDVTGSVAATTTILSSGATSGIGYSTGAGGAVTQGTSRTTGVTLNNVSGAITMFSAAGSATAATFTVTNSTVAATDTIIVNQKSGTNLYVLLVTAVSAGSFNITFYTTGGTATDAPVINFSVIKAVAA